MILRPYKRIKELEEETWNLRNDKSELEEKLKEMRNKEERNEKGYHSPTALCGGCKHLVVQRYGYPYGCKLDCKCEDREDA